jgi:hypothetical protein
MVSWKVPLLRLAELGDPVLIASDHPVPFEGAVRDKHRGAWASTTINAVLYVALAPLAAIRTYTTTIAPRCRMPAASYHLAGVTRRQRTTAARPCIRDEAHLGL